MLRSKVIAGFLLAGALSSSVVCSTVTTGESAAQQILVSPDCLDYMSFEDGKLTLYVTHSNNNFAIIKALATLAVVGGGLWGAVSLGGSCTKSSTTNGVSDKTKLLMIAFATGVLSAYLATSAYHDVTSPKERIPYIMLDAHGLSRCDGMHLVWSDFEYSDAVGADERHPIFAKGSNLTLESFYDTGVQLPIPFKQFRMIAVQYLAACGR